MRVCVLLVVSLKVIKKRKEFDTTQQQQRGFSERDLLYFISFDDFSFSNLKMKKDKQKFPKTRQRGSGSKFCKTDLK